MVELVPKERKRGVGTKVQGRSVQEVEVYGFREYNRTDPACNLKFACTPILLPRQAHSVEVRTEANSAAHCGRQKRDSGEGREHESFEDLEPRIEGAMGIGN